MSSLSVCFLLFVIRRSLPQILCSPLLGTDWYFQISILCLRLVRTSNLSRAHMMHDSSGPATLAINAQQ